MAKAVYTLPVPVFENTKTRCFDYDQKTQLVQGFKSLWIDIINGIQKHDETDKEYKVNKAINTFQEKGRSRQVNNPDKASDRSRNSSHSRSDTKYSSSKVSHYPRDQHDRQHAEPRRNSNNKYRNTYHSRENPHYREKRSKHGEFYHRRH